jgi:transcriptional regulator with XRE-family HTH domain
MGFGGELYVALGEVVRTHRERAGLTQGELARRVGMTRTSITNIESGRQKVQLHTLYDIAHAVDVSPQALLPSPEAVTPEAIEDRLPEGLSPVEREWMVRVLTGDAE